MTVKENTTRKERIMKNLKIIVTNTAKLEAAIKEAEGRATARCISPKTITDTVERLRIPKSRLNGTRIHWTGAQKMPNAYKYRPDSTHWTAEYINRKWYLTGVWRDTCPNHSNGPCFVEYSDAAKEYILSQACRMESINFKEPLLMRAH